MAVFFKIILLFFVHLTLCWFNILGSHFRQVLFNLITFTNSKIPITYFQLYFQGNFSLHSVTAIKHLT